MSKETGNKGIIFRQP